MRIIHLVSNRVWAGGEQYVLDLARSSARDGDEVTVVTRGLDVVDRHFAAAGLPMVRMRLGGMLDFATPRALARLINSGAEGETVVHVHNFKDAEMAARARRHLDARHTMRLVCTRHLVKRGGTGARWRRLYKSMDALVFVSALARDGFMESAPPVGDLDIRVIHNGVDAPDPVEKPACGSGPLRALYCGRLHPEKGLDVLLQAMARLPRGTVRLSVGGTGDAAYEEELHRLAETLGIGEEVEWLGFVNDVFPALNRADVCVLPSIVREACPLSVLEGGSQGRAVLATDNGGQREFVTPGKEGMLVPPGDVGSLAEALEEMAANPHLVEEMGARGRESYLREHTYRRFYDKIRAVYSKG